MVIALSLYEICSVLKVLKPVKWKVESIEKGNIM